MCFARSNEKSFRSSLEFYIILIIPTEPSFITPFGKLGNSHFLDPDCRRDVKQFLHLKLSPRKLSLCFVQLNRTRTNNLNRMLNSPNA